MARTSGELFESARAERERQAVDRLVATGLRIRGAGIASATFVFEWKTICETGQSLVANVLRAILQNIGGGRKASAGNKVPGGRCVDFGGRPSINHRGPGSDAALTLLDGLRWCYTGSTQGGGLSAIPDPNGSREATDTSVTGCFRGRVADTTWASPGNRYRVSAKNCTICGPAVRKN
jgi:hypothetical protein